MAPTELLSAILIRTNELVSRQTECFKAQIIPQLLEVGIEFMPYPNLDSDEIVFLKSYYQKRVHPVSVQKESFQGRSNKR